MLTISGSLLGNVYLNREKRKSFCLSSCPCVFSLTLRVHQVLFFTGLKVEPRTFARISHAMLL